MRLPVCALCLLVLSCQTPSGCGPPRPGPTGGPTAEPPVGPDAEARLVQAIEDFCRADFDAPGLRDRFGPGAVRAGGKTLPPGTTYYIESEAVTTLYTADPHMRVIWWPRPAEGSPVGELHIVPETPTLVYADFVRDHGLGAGETLAQGHELADVEHRHTYTCAGKRSVGLVLGEVVWKGDAVGRIGRVTVLKGER
jgi:hypothetical protein